MIFLFSATPALAWNPFTEIYNYIFGTSAVVIPAPAIPIPVKPIVTPPKTDSTGSLQANTTSPITIIGTPTPVKERIVYIQGPAGPRGLVGPTGPQGPKGDPGLPAMAGTSAVYSPQLQPAFVGVIQPNPATNFSGATLFSATNLSSNQFTTSTANITNLTVSGNTTLTGSLNVTGTVNIPGLTTTSLNGLTITSSGGITNSTSINPLTTLAESWIGPSSTTGIYFKGGNVGIGTITPTTALSVAGAISVTDTANTRANLGLTYSANGDTSTFTQIEAWGDSLTAGAGGTPFPAQLQSKSGLYVYNQGVGAEDSTQIKTRMLADTASHSKPTIIWAGNNNPNVPVTVKADIASMVAALTTNNYLILGMVNGDYADKYMGQPAYNTLVQLNSDLATIYGSHFIDIRSYLVSLYNPNIAQDVTDHTRDIIPSSLRSDNIHLTTAGYGYVADKIYQSLETLLSTPRFNSSVMTPASLLSLRANANFGRVAVGVDITDITSTSDVYSNNLFQVSSSTATVGNGLVVNQYGFVGIGTTSPRYSLDIRGQRIKISVPTNLSAFFHAENLGGTMYVGMEQSPGGGLLTGDTAFAAVIEASGALMQMGTHDTLGMSMFWNWQNGVKVGIGTFVPSLSSAKFTVQGVAGYGVLNIASSTGASLVYVAANDSVGIGTTDPHARLSIGGGAARSTTEGTNRLDIFNGTAPVGTLANGISIYSSSGEAYIMDAAGNATLQSPHDLNTNYWVFDSKNAVKGTSLLIDMEQMMKQLNVAMGWDYVHETLNGVTLSTAPISLNLPDTFFSAITTRITTWLADTTNGIAKIFVGEVYTNKLCVKKSDGNNVCVTGDQLDALLASPPSQGGVPASSGGGGNPATCSDGIQNQDETGVDTGGVCTPTVLVTLESIAITTPATKLSYTVGDTLDITDLAITGTYSDATTQVETITDSNITGFDSGTAVTGQVLTITVGEKITTYTIDVIK